MEQLFITEEGILDSQEFAMLNNQGSEELDTFIRDYGSDHCCWSLGIKSEGWTIDLYS